MNPKDIHIEAWIKCERCNGKGGNEIENSDMPGAIMGCDYCNNTGRKKLQLTLSELFEMYDKKGYMP